MLKERQKLLRAPPGIWLVFRQWFCTRWSQTPPAPEQLQLQHNSAWWCDPPVLLHAQGHTWTCLAKPADPAQRCRPVVNVLCSELKSFSLPLPLSPPPPRPSLPPSASVSEDGEAALQSDSSHSGGEGGGQEQPLALLWLLPSVSVCLSSLLWRRRWLLAGFVQPFERLHSFSPSLFFCFYLLLHPVTFDPKLDLPYPPPPTPHSQGWQKVTSPSSTLHWTQTGRWGLTVMKWCHFWHHHPLSRHEQPQHGSESPKTVFVFLMMFVSNCKHPGPQTANQRPLSVCVCLCVLTSCDASADTAVPVSSSSKSAFVDFHFIVIFFSAWLWVSQRGMLGYYFCWL